MNNELQRLEIVSNDCDILLELVHRFIDEKNKIDPNDHFAFMSFCFLPKQIEHMRSMRILLDSGQYSDTVIIARIMVEGLAMLAFALNNSDENIALKWRSFPVILNYRLFLDKKKNGLEVSKKDENEIFEELNKFGNLFLKDKNISITKSNLFVPDPFSKNWTVDNHGKEIRKTQFVKNLQGKLIEIYLELSGWVHWDVKKMAQMINWDNSSILKIDANTNYVDDAKFALGAGFLSLYGIIEMINNHLKLELTNELNKVRLKFESDLSSIHKSI
jgi:hypothetical protein